MKKQIKHLTAPTSAATGPQVMRQRIQVNRCARYSKVQTVIPASKWLPDRPGKNAGFVLSQMGCAFPSGAGPPTGFIVLGKTRDSPTGRQNCLNHINHLNRKTS